jgi:uncharacterized membrane protein YjjP (DUF1212 family)
MDRDQFLRRVKFILKFGKALHGAGAPAHSLEGTMQDLCLHFGIQGSILSLPTSISCSFNCGDEEVTRVERVEPMGVNLGKLSQVDLVAQEVVQGRLSYEEGNQKLEEILNAPETYGKRIRLLCFVLSAAGFMVLFGGTWGDFLASVTVGLLIGLISLVRPQGHVAQLFEALVAVASAFATYFLAKLFPALNVGVVIISSLIIFMPGLLITIAIAEIATQNLTSGTSRLVGGVMILLKLTFGVFIGHKFSTWFHMSPINFEFDMIPRWLPLLTLPVTALMAMVIFKADRSDWGWVTVAGMFGYFCSKFGAHYLGPELGMFFGGVCVGAMSNVFARLKNRPSSIFQFPGIILLVPGSVGYRSFNFLFERNMVGGLDTAFTMVSIAMALVVGLFFGNILVKPRRSL